MSSALVVQDEFGPLGLLSTIAHGYYIDGVAAGAVDACSNWLVVARAVGAEVTVRYLLYVQAISLIDLGRYSEALEVGSELLESLGTEPEPAWRCKSLAVIAESTVRMNKPSGAIAPLAEADWLLRAVDRASYPTSRRSMAVALALRSANLVEPSDEILRGLRGGGEPDLEMLIAQEAALLSAHWGTILLLIGRLDDAAVQFRTAATRALKMQRWARLAGNTAMAARGQVIEAYGMLHLGEEPLAVARARAAAERFVARPELLETRLLHLVLGTAYDAADLHEAREHLTALLRDAESSDPTWAAAGRVALAELDTIEHGESEGTRMWREVAQDALRSVWGEREARFAALRDQDSIRHLTAQADRFGRESLEDPLTGLGNRRMLARIAREAGRPGGRRLHRRRRVQVGQRQVLALRRRRGAEGDGHDPARPVPQRRPAAALRRRRVRGAPARRLRGGPSRRKADPRSGARAPLGRSGPRPDGHRLRRGRRRRRPRPAALRRPGAADREAGGPQPGGRVWHHRGVSAEFLLTALVVVAIPGTGVNYTLAADLALGPRAAVVAAAGAPGSAWRVIGNGVAVNLLNPKLTVSFLAFLPQFVPAGTPGSTERMLGRSAVFMAVTLVAFVAYGVFAGVVRARVSASPHVVTRVRRTFGVGFALLAGRLAFTER